MRNRVSVRTRVQLKSTKGLNPGRRIQLHNDDFSQINTTYDDQLEYKTPSIICGLVKLPIRSKLEITG